ncbi:MAG: isoprenylcysteine carboxylmethyltransferase family protein [Gammaproteobacteria bacterium]|nr:isoprenylcysteine carboxylmethyltransferase family protein [Gammaproteobacteria bacterium]
MPKPELKIPPVVLVLIAAVLMWALAEAMPIPFTLPGAALVAVAVAALGIVIAVLGVVQFRSAGTTVDPRVPERSSTLVVGGIYRFSRNPMYVGMLLVLCAWALYLGSIAALVMLPLFVICITQLQIKPEERHMQAKFGNTYQQYKSRVRRWI